VKMITICFSSASCASAKAAASPAEAASSMALKAAAAAMLVGLHARVRRHVGVSEKAVHGLPWSAQAAGCPNQGFTSAAGLPGRPGSSTQAGAHASQEPEAAEGTRVPKVLARLKATSAMLPAGQPVPNQMAAASSTAWGAPAWREARTRAPIQSKHGRGEEESVF
jgi:hypothetical protein